jgi:DnaJ-domain-containing protein 1
LLDIPDGEDSPPVSGDEDQESPDDEYEDEEYNGAADEDDEPEVAKPWYEILGVPPSASPREINVAYREHVKTCHPDLVAGLDPEFRELAEAKAKALNAAREEGLGRN